MCLGADFTIDVCIFVSKLCDNTKELRLTRRGRSGIECMRLCDSMIVLSWSFVTPKFSIDGILRPERMSSWDGSIGLILTNKC